MNKEERAEWVARGYKDPVAAFRSHIATAKVRGIAFRMTFEEWWSVWAPHYELSEQDEESFADLVDNG